MLFFQLNIHGGGTHMAEKYLVTLTEEERTDLRELLQKGKSGSRKLTRAHILLLADEGESDDAITAALHTSLSTVHRVRQQFVEASLEQALHERQRPGSQRKLNGRETALLVALACSDPPRGQTRWTMQLLADRLMELKIVDMISDETVRQTLKKTNSSPGNGNSGISRRSGRSLSGGWKMSWIYTN
jgi:transposase